MVNKSKKNRNRLNKSIKNKRGGKKNHSLITTQMAGSKFGYNTLLTQSGGNAPAPSPAGYPFNLGNIEPTSLSTALQQFGDAVQSFIDTASSTKTAYTLASNAVEAQGVASSNLTSAIQSLSNAYYGPSWMNEYGISINTTPTATNPSGLYKIIMGSTFNATRVAPAPAPA
jgi:hypothetical protein